jgi:hypothetical protein
MDGMICNPSDGRSGGVIMLWKKEIKVEQILGSRVYMENLDGRKNTKPGTSCVN